MLAALLASGALRGPAGALPSVADAPPPPPASEPVPADTPSPAADDTPPPPAPAPEPTGAGTQAPAGSMADAPPEPGATPPVTYRERNIKPPPDERALARQSTVELGVHRQRRLYRPGGSPQRFAVELKFGPYIPDVDRPTMARVLAPTAPSSARPTRTVWPPRRPSRAWSPSSPSSGSSSTCTAR